MTEQWTGRRRRPTRPGRDAIRQAAVVGAGLIGTGWAALLAAHGVAVSLYDRDELQARRAREEAAGAVELLVGEGLAGAEVAARGVEELKVAATLAAAVSDAAWVQECVYESLSLKQSLLTELDRLTGAGVILASSTSGLLASALAEGLACPGRFLVVHPLNPPYLVPLVEIVPSPGTESWAVERAHRFCQRLGRVPVVLAREVPGHISGRIAAAVWREASHLVLEGVATPAEIDHALAAGPFLGWAVQGPHLTYHLAGGPGGLRGFMDHLLPAFGDWWRDLAAWQQLPPAAQEQLARAVEDDYGAAPYVAHVQARDRRLAALMRLLSGRDDWPPAPHPSGK